MIKAVLFDTRSTLLDDGRTDLSARNIIREIAERLVPRNIEQVVKEAEGRAITSYAPNLFETIIFELVKHDQMEALKYISTLRKNLQPKPKARDEAMGIVRYCHNRRWKVGLANTLTQADGAALEKAGLLAKLQFKGIPVAMKIELPDARVVEFALGNLGVRPDECIFVGARLDHSVRLGNIMKMTTVRVRLGTLGKRQEPRDLSDVPDYEAEDLVSLIQTLDSM